MSKSIKEVTVTIKRSEAGLYGVHFNGLLMCDVVSRSKLKDDWAYEIFEESCGAFAWYIRGEEGTRVKSAGADSKRELIEWLEDTALIFDQDFLAEIKAAAVDAGDHDSLLSAR